MDFNEIKDINLLSMQSTSSTTNLEISKYKTNLSIIKNLSYSIKNKLNQLNIWDVNEIIRTNSYLLWDNSLWETVRSNFYLSTFEIQKIFNSNNEYIKLWITWILRQVDKIAKDATHNLYNELFKFFIPNSVKLEKILLPNKTIFDNDFYLDFKKLNYWEKLIKSLYVLTSIYQLSYVVWLVKINSKFKNILKTNPKIVLKHQKNIQNILTKLNISNNSEFEWKAISQLANMISFAIPKDIFSILEENLEAVRIKTFESSVLKLLKKNKYVNEYRRENILADQIWFLFRFKKFDNLQKIWKILLTEYKVFEIIDFLIETIWVDNAQISKKFKKERLDVDNLKLILSEDISDNNKIYKIISLYFPKYKNHSIFINKFNDRWVIWKKFDNKDTIDNIIPFLNTWYIFVDKEISNNLQLWELSFRTNEDKIISDILQDKVLKTKREKLLVLISKIDSLNHWIYKISEEIKILRKLFVDDKIVRSKKNINSWSKKFLNDKLIQLNKDIKIKIKDRYDSISFDNDDIEYVVLKILGWKVHNVIKELAWEKTKENVIHNSVEYENLAYIEKKELLKKMWIQFLNALDKNKNNIVWLWKFNSLSNNAYRDFKHNYKIIKKTSIFYPEINARLSVL